MQSAKGAFEEVLTIRLKPESDVLEGIEAACREYGVQNGVLLSGIGSWSSAVYCNPTRLEDGRVGYGTPYVREGLLELVSLSGIICHDDEGVISPHIHLTLTSGEGAAFGGHLCYGCKVLLTTDIVIGVVGGIDMLRRFDPELRVPLFHPVQK